MSMSDDLLRRLSNDVRQHLTVCFLAVDAFPSTQAVTALFDVEASANTLKAKLEAIEAEVRGRTEGGSVATGASALERTSAPPPPYLRQTPSCGNRGEREPGR